MKQFTPGGIRCPEAYAQGKMLDHSAWSGQMARGITPSDIDAFIESSGCFLFWELTRDAGKLEDIATGQRIALARLAKLPGTHCLAILRHGLFSISKLIDTANDINEATIYFDTGTRHVVLDGAEWRDFAVAWTYGPKAAIDKCLRTKLEE